MSYSDFGFGDLLRCLAGMGVAIPVNIVANSAISLWKSPRVLWSSYKALWKTEKIGPNLKCLISTLLPPSLLITLGLIPIASTGWGVYRGLCVARELEELPGLLGKDITEFVKTIDEILSDRLESNAVLKLDDDQEKIDLRFLDMIKSAAISLISLPVSFSGTAVHAGLKFPSLVKRTWQFFTEFLNKNIFVGVLCLILSIIAIVLAPLSYLLLSSGYSLYKTATSSYREGVVKGVNSIFSSLKESRKMYSDLLKSLKSK